MPCPHNEITIVQRSQRQSAVAAAAYQSGEKLFCEYDQQVKHYPEKRGIVHNEILLPANAPPEYADRNTLSFEKLNAVVQTDTAAKLTQGTKLFIAPEIKIKPGSKIIVEQNGTTTEYSASGEPAVYFSHSEYMLELFKGWA